ncbi:MAG: hypothetical protein Q9218_007971 [Villophora microphyllina]
MKYNHPTALLAFIPLLMSESGALPTANEAATHLQRRYDTHTLATYEYTGAHWTTPVKIGNQILNLLVDTGSSDLWVFSPYVHNPVVNGFNHTLYDYTKSPGSGITTDCGPDEDIHTPCKTNSTFDISYSFPDSEVKGFVVNDWVSVGATDPVQMNVEVATVVNNAFKGAPIDGILGLGFQSENHVSPFMTRLLGVNRTQGEEGPTLPVFTVDVDPKRNGSLPTFEIGKIDLQKANGSLSYAPVNHTTGRWLVEDVAFEVADQIVNVTGAMVIDTGGSGYFNVPSAVAKAYYAHVGARDLSGNNSYYFPCSSTMVPMTMHIGNGTATYNDLPNWNSSVSGICTGPILGNATDFGNVGKYFFEKYFTVFDYKAQAVQYAPHA